MKFFLMFFSIFFSVVFSLHYYTIRRLSHIFEFQYSWKIFPVIILVIANVVAVIFISRYYWNSVTRIWLAATESYLGVLWIMFWLLLGYSLIQGTAHFIHPIPPRVSQYFVVGAAVLLVGYGLWNARQIRIHRIEVASKKILEPVTIVQLSDLHIGAINRESFVEWVVAQTNALRPDLVVITGDLFDIGATKELVQGFNKLNAASFFIWGNHDQFLKAGEVENMLGSTPITMLKNETSLYHDSLQIIGLDYMEREPDYDVKPILTSLAPDERYFTMLLSHAPIDFSELEGYAIDLELAGHTHSGQIFPFHFLVKTRYKLLRGLYKSGNQSIYVSSGTGTWGPPMRLGTSSEIAVFYLSPLPADRQEDLIVRKME
ncbi:hypothetical protein CSA56_07635 [candidate division KSB3 bacterium]|uniref:Calcineurin-like phosphoesterase domain-containing protein n=1 Tax=candidate division KSB3 bacterium TaxID=2044937 RepID=A0A2G6KFN1_9BACT|nr:MAG: hypothetical protein CSA56_07635 [candidate division KSB3 bacterium]